MNRRTWRRVVWKNCGEDRSSGYAVQGEWRACPVVLGQRMVRSFAAWGWPRKVGIWMALVRGNPLPGQAHVGGRWSLLGSLRIQRLATLMDRLDWRGGLFLEWASATFGDGEQRGRGELSEDNSSFAGRSILSGAVASLPLPGREGGNGRGDSRDCLARPASNCVRRRLFSSCNRFACSRSSATCLACSSCLASKTWRHRRNWSLGAKFAGFLVMVLNSDGPMGGLGIAKALQIGGSLGSKCTQALAYYLCDFLLGVSHRRRQMWSPDFSESLNRRGIHQLTATCKTKRRRRWCSVAPPMTKSVFFWKTWNLEQ